MGKPGLDCGLIILRTWKGDADGVDLRVVVSELERVFHFMDGFGSIGESEEQTSIGTEARLALFNPLPDKVDTFEF